MNYINVKYCNLKTVQESKECGGIPMLTPNVLTEIFKLSQILIKIERVF